MGIPEHCVVQARHSNFWVYPTVYTGMRCTRRYFHLGTIALALLIGGLALVGSANCQNAGADPTVQNQYAPAVQGGPPPIGPPGTYPVPTPSVIPQTPEVEQAMRGNMDLLAVSKWLVKTGKTALVPSSTQATAGFKSGPQPAHQSKVHRSRLWRAYKDVGNAIASK